MADHRSSTRIQLKPFEQRSIPDSRIGSLIKLSTWISSRNFWLDAHNNDKSDYKLLLMLETNLLFLFSILFCNLKSFTQGNSGCLRSPAWTVGSVSPDKVRKRLWSRESKHINGRSRTFIIILNIKILIKQKHISNVFQLLSPSPCAATRQRPCSFSEATRPNLLFELLPNFKGNENPEMRDKGPVN